MKLIVKLIYTLIVIIDETMAIHLTSSEELVTLQNAQMEVMDKNHIFCKL